MSCPNELKRGISSYSEFNKTLTIHIFNYLVITLQPKLAYKNNLYQKKEHIFPHRMVCLKNLKKIFGTSYLGKV